MSAHVVGEHQDLLVRFVAKIVIDAFLLHQPADERKVALLVLHAVVPFAIAREQTLVDRKAIPGQHLPKNLHNRQILEDAAVGRPCQVPQPWPQRDRIDVRARRVSLAAAERASRDVSAEMAHAAVGRDDFKRQRLAEQTVHVERGRLADQFHVEFVQRRQRFLAVQRTEPECLRIERRVGSNDVIHDGPC